MHLQNAWTLRDESAFDVLAKAKRLEAQGRQIIHLEIGQPDFQTPSIFVKRHSERWRWVYGYGPAGLLELREVIAEHVSTTRGIDISPDRWSPWSQTDYLFTLLALVDEGDEVIYPDPGFPIYESVINFVGAREFPYLYEKTLVSLSYWRFGWCSFWADTVINSYSPQNPTGGFWEKMTWKWSRICK